MSQVVYRHCASTQEDAIKLAPAVDWPLITFYQDIDYGGDSDTIMGTQGDCDASGYGLTLSIENFVIGGITSFHYNSSCDGQTGWYWANRTGACGKIINHYGSMEYIGDDCNDHLWSMHVYKYYT
ncbi:MAG: hypothetical protein J2O49_01070 [Sciscionella sp.]|nr:hypothetical protein [Sciscionella sp.]